MKRPYLAGCVLALVLGAGCASSDSDGDVVVRPQPQRELPPLVPPGPNVMTMGGTMAFKLPTTLASEAGIPPEVKGTISIEARSEVVSTEPLRSKYTTAASIHIADTTGEALRFDFEGELTGERDGKPLGIIELLLSVEAQMSFFTKAFGAATTQPSGH